MHDKTTNKKIVAFRYGNALKLIIGGKHRTIQGSDQKIEKIYQAALEAKSNPTEENVSHLEDLIDPTSKWKRNGNLKEDIDGNLYLGDTDTPLPRELSETLIEHMENDHPIEALENFWKLCLLNPDERARDGFFQYVQDYGVAITDNGYALLYKAVTQKEKAPREKDLAELVATKQTSIKRFGDNPSDHVVLKAEMDGEERLDPDVRQELEDEWYEQLPDRLRVDVYNGSLENYIEQMAKPEDYIEESGDYKFEVVDTTKVQPSRAAGILSDEGWDRVTKEGTIEELYQQIHVLSERSPTTYTDKYTKTFDIKLGEPVKMDRDECDHDPSIGCSQGLHVGSFDYVSHYGYGGDTIMAVLVNPANIVALPTHDNSKIRTCEYLPVGIMEQDEHGNWDEIESGYWESDYKDYEEEWLEAELDRITAQQLDNTAEALNTERSSNGGDEDLNERRQIIKDRLVTITDGDYGRFQN